MPIKLFLMFAVVSLSACHTLKPAAPIQQGITGLVSRQTGNQMPSPGRVPRQPKGFKCDLYIYQAATLKDATGNSPSFTSIKTKLVTVLHTDSNGHYSTYLPVGKYSVFIKDGDSFFADEGDGTGTLNPVEVVNGKVTKRDWVLRSGAVY